jgi:hypothetical protein
MFKIVVKIKQITQKKFLIPILALGKHSTDVYCF